MYAISLIRKEILSKFALTAKVNRRIGIACRA